MTGPDPGIFGPASVTWRVHADPTLGVGGLRALFLQALNPPVVAAVVRHSTFRADPWGRLIRTAEYVGTLTYGTTLQAHRASARVRAMHALVPGAGDPDLLLWVHCCDVDSFLSTPRRAGLRLSAEGADRYVAEQARAARLLGVDRAPESLAEMAAYFDDMRPSLAASPAAYDAARFILLPPMPGAVGLVTPARPAWAGLATLGFSLLPRWARRMYGMPGLPTTDLGATVAVRALRTALLAVPKQLRDGPRLKEAQLRLQAASP